MTGSVQPLALFISYSHKDDDLRAKLDTHLSLLKRQNVFDVWHDRRIAAGREWAGAIDDALEKADVVLLLVSSDFLASDYCYDKEMMRALQRHDQGTARVVPVILRPCDWQSSNFGKLQALPRDGRPVVSYADPDTAFTEVSVALRALADEMRGNGTTSEQPSATSDKGSAAQPGRRRKRKLKIGRIKLGFVEIGPIELEWPPRMGVARLVVLMLIGVCAAAGVTYWIFLKPGVDNARDFMRRGEYKNAASSIDSVPRWSKDLPFIARVAAQARFGAKLEDGEHIRDLAPELEALRARYPDESNVLVFQGLSAYYVDNNPDKALERFRRAADHDPAHLEAHFLAAERYIDLAYAALGRSDEPQARSAATQARAMMDSAVSRSSFASTLPRYANEMAELYELEGDAARAYAGYARLAALQPLSALQAAFVSWRLAQPRSELRYGLENAEAAIAQIEKEPERVIELEGWSFRVAATQLVDTRFKVEKLCLFAWAVEISKSLQSTSESKTPIATPARPAPVGSPAPCGEEAVELAARMRDIVCVQVLTAQRAIPSSDSRQEVLDEWRGAPLQCPPELQPMPVLSGDSRELDL
jgi:tetratricopeptide (TPR) repeat protein